jgi:hypothetical protein
MKSFAGRHPVLFAILAILVYCFGMHPASALLSGLHLSELAEAILVQGIFSLLVAALILSLRWWHDTGFAGLVKGRSLLAYAPWLLLLVIMLPEVKASGASLSRIAGFGVFALLVGFGEEGLLRGIALRALLPKGEILAAIVSSIIFGAAHLVNLLAGRDPASTVVQVVYATFIGIGFAGPRLYTGTIWPAVVIHALIDFLDGGSRGFGIENPTEPMTFGRAIVPIAITGLYALHGLWLIRRKRVSRGLREASLGKEE